MRTWAYIVAALLGSLGGAMLDAVLYHDGGSMLTKIGLVAGPVALWAVGRRRREEGDR